jgi:hypothetical protein
MCVAGPTKNHEYYRPLESPPQYPLELRKCPFNGRLEILLWAESGEHCWTIAAWNRTWEGYELQFVGDRPLDERVKWKAFGKCVKQGQAIADDMFNNGVGNE